ncbi:MAG: hypothetical protein Q4G52_02630 [Clostridia bacterium]|nr:hypothetical protein [Clostridia bacterium]
MNKKQKARFAAALGLALAALSGCDGTQGGTIDYIDGHWVYVNEQTSESVDLTQLLENPDAFYTAASAMSDDELQRSFDLLSSAQCADLFRSLGEERALTLAGRLTQAQVERLLEILQAQDRVESLSEPAALAAVWHTLTTDEQLAALSGLSSDDYAALWALLGEEAASAPSVSPDPVSTPDWADPAYLSGIWHTLTAEEQSAALSELSSAQFVSLWRLLEEQGAASPAASATPSPAADGGEIAPAASPSPLPESETQTQATPEQPESPAPPSAEAPTEEPEETAPEETPNPAAIAENWFAMTPEEQLAAINQMTAEQFAALEELLPARPKPTPAEEDVLFIPTAKPIQKPESTPTPVPQASPDALSPEPEQTAPPEPDWNDPVYLAGIWHTLSPQEQLSVLSKLTTEQYIALQNLLAQTPSPAPSAPDDAQQAEGETPKSEPAPDESPEPEDEEPSNEPSENPSESGGDLTPAEETPLPSAPQDPVPAEGEGNNPPAEDDEPPVPPALPDSPAGNGAGGGQEATPSESLSGLSFPSAALSSPPFRSHPFSGRMDDASVPAFKRRKRIIRRRSLPRPRKLSANLTKRFISKTRIKSPQTA